jgi:predicted protein tyrosine phosphatase
LVTHPKDEARSVRVQPKQASQPTAEQVYSSRADLEVLSAGTNNDAETPLSSDLIEWADIIFVMEKAHRSKVQQRFRGSLKGTRVVCLDILDQYAFMDPALIRLLETKGWPAPA